MLLQVNSKPLLPNHLVEEDFINAAFVRNNRHAKLVFDDQRFHKVSKQRRGSVSALESDKWPNGRIPYVLSTAYTPQQRAVLALAISAYNAKTCIRFVPKTSIDVDYVDIAKIDGCFADFSRVGGRQQVSLVDECIEYATIIHEFMHVIGLCFADFSRVGGRQQVSLVDECIEYATIIHEFMHVIGFIHEHQREDRDGFVRIMWENVIDGANADFEKLSSMGLSNYGERYDYFSIMHYENTEGSKNGRPTIVANVPEYSALMGKSMDFTQGDLNRVNRAYKCYQYLKTNNEALNQHQNVEDQAAIFRRFWTKQQYINRISGVNIKNKS
uniref:Metalloendopeptidase n=1 Tax=Meloidogyne incognita TaxID=6306 RepID=A0A914NM01_MELIC